MKKIIYILLLIVVIVIICFLSIKLEGPSNFQKRIYNDNKLIAQEGDSYYSSGLLKRSNKIEVKDFTGSYTIWQYNSDNNFKLEFSFDNDVKNGKLKAVLIKDNEFYKNLDSNNYDLEPGEYRIKLVGLYSTSIIKYEIKIS